MVTPFDSIALNDDLPRYPPLIQLIRVTSTRVAGPPGTSQVAGSSFLAPGLYVAFVEQLRTDSLIPRDREPCLADDVNGLGLSPGFYLGRLAGSWTSLPVYEIIAPSVGNTSVFDHWVLITSVSDVRAAGYQVTPIGNGDFQAVPGGYLHRITDQPLYERNDMAGVPVGAIVWVRYGGEGGSGREWVYEWGRIPAIITLVYDSEEPIRYLCNERVLGQDGVINPKTDGRNFEFCYELNGNLVEAGTVVWLFRGFSNHIDGEIKELWFDHPATVDDSNQPTHTVNVTDITQYTGLPDNWYFNTYNSTLYRYIEGYGFYAVCCPGVPSGGGSSSGASGGASGGAGGGSILTECCPQGVPLTLYGEVTNKTGSASIIPDDLVFNFLSAGPPTNWETAQFDHSSLCGFAGTAHLTFACTLDTPGSVGDGWFVSSSLWTYGTMTLVSQSCDPFEVVIDVSATNFCSFNSGLDGTFRIRITGTP